MDHQLIVLLIFGVIGIFNWLIRKGAKEGNMDKGSPPFTPQRTVRPRQAEATESEEERMRKFLEALGVPANTEPPRKIVRPQEQPIPRIQAPVQRELSKQTAPKKVYVPPLVVPPIPKSPEPQPERAAASYETAASFPQTVETVTAAMAVPDAVPATLVSSPASAQPVNLVGLQSLLKSPSSIRAAFVLKEVLGPPKSLQPLAGMSGLL